MRPARGTGKGAKKRQTRVHVLRVELSLKHYGGSSSRFKSWGVLSQSVLFRTSSIQRTRRDRKGNLEAIETVWNVDPDVN